LANKSGSANGVDKRRSTISNININTNEIACYGRTGMSFNDTLQIMLSKAKKLPMTVPAKAANFNNDI